MKDKILTAGLCSLMLLAAPAFAATTTNSASSGTATNAAAANTGTQSNVTADRIVAQAVAPVHQVEADQHFSSLLKQAKGIVIVPSMFKGALVAGGSGGDGVLLARRNGQWTDPAFITVGSVSIGPQVGAKEGPVVMLLMTDKALNDFTSRNNFSLNANAGLTVINYSAKGQGGLGKGDVVVWSGAGGAFVGASVSGSDITADTKLDSQFYGKSLTTAQIIHGQVRGAQSRAAAANPLRTALPT